MFFNKINVKDFVKLLFGFNIICLISILLLNYYNIIRLSKFNLIYLSIFALLFICIFMNEKYYNDKAGYYFYSIVFVGDLFFTFQVFYKLGRNYIK